MPDKRSDRSASAAYQEAKLAASSPPARWPAWHPRLAAFLMDDPLAALREELSRRHAEAGGPAAQAQLPFAEAT